MNEAELLNLIQAALGQRQAWITLPYQSAFRLFNGFSEGFPDLAIEVYGRTLVLFNFADQPESILNLVSSAIDYLCSSLPWIQCVVIKTRNATEKAERHGLLIRGEHPDERVCENGVWYAINLQMSSDTSLYLDTRDLRSWIMQNSNGLRVLNTFAYTGSLGIAAKAGGARQVIHLDKNRKFLEFAKASYRLNGFPIQAADFVAQDFFPWTSRMRRAKQRFDMVFLDPPFFSLTPRGRVDLEEEYGRIINKVRPLVKEGGTLVAINNAIFVSGSKFIHQLEELCQGGYLSIEEIIPVPADFSGYSRSYLNNLPANPAPFNHTTKIVILKVRKAKDPL